MSTPTRYPNGLSVDAIGNPLANLTIPNPTKIAMYSNDFFVYDPDGWQETKGGLGSVAALAPVSTNATLGTAAGFVVLAASAITNTGASAITGNIGIFPGTAITGFPPGTVSGTTSIATSAARQAQIDATAAYATLSTIASTATIATALDGQTLTSTGVGATNVYTTAAGTMTLAASGGGTLTLSGDATSIFILRTASTLITGAGGTPVITLAGGAVAKNVYWVVGSSATINSGSAGTFNGNVIAVASITDTIGGTVNGSLIALNGAVTLSAATTIVSQVTTSSTAAPGPDGWLAVIVNTTGTEAIQQNPPAFNFRAGTSLLAGLQTWFTARVKLDATVANPDYTVGLTAGPLTTLNSATDGVYFTKATGATVWSLVIKAAAGGTTTLALPATTVLVNSATVELSYYYDGSKNVLYVYFNKALVGTVSDGTSASVGLGSLGSSLANLPGPTILLAPTVLNAYHTAGSTIFVDYIVAAVDRT